ncbi:MAG: ATP-binding protein [Candidatus Omnitrophica bacterium]|nr:ATP-binding protein [Candidatus Omnitrophota bacterium]
MKTEKSIYPFTAIVGQDLMKLGLILNVINPTLSGVLIRGEKGTAKSTAVRALADILPEIDVMKDCPFQCDPKDILMDCPHCQSPRQNVLKCKVKIVELPVSSTEDRVIGTLDIEQALKSGEKRIEPGLLAQAHRGILYVDEVNLLDDHIVDVLLDSAAMGVNKIEREGISFSHPACFVLIGTMNPEEGELRPQLLDRFGLCVNIHGLKDVNDRVEIIKRREDFESDPKQFRKRWQTKDDELSNKIILARKFYSEVLIHDDILRKIVSLAVELNIDGHRGEIMMMKTAKTIAAFEQRKEVNLENVEMAAELCLPHRIRRKPFENIGLDKKVIKNYIQKDIAEVSNV